MLILQGNDGTAQDSQQGFDLTKELYDWVEAIVFSLTVVVIIFTFLFRIVGVEGDSMKNTLHSGDRIIISNMNYKPNYSDIVVVSVKSISDPIIKRVIALGGDTVEIDYKNHKVLVNDKEINEPYIKEAMMPAGDGPLNLTVPIGSIFVMGDNRNNSMDSRFGAVGTIDTRYIIGHAIFRLFPISGFGFLKK